MAVLPGRADPEQTDGLDLRELNLIVAELRRAGQSAWQSRLTGALGTRAIPAQELEVIARLVTIRPLNRQEASRPVGEDVERALTIVGADGRVLP